MIRRRRRSREIPFSFDSFLDIVANVVGIIIRLILVVWVGARSYSSIKNLARPETVAAESPAEVKELTDPLQQEIEQQRRELARLQEELLAHLRQVQVVERDRQLTEKELAAVESQGHDLERTLTAQQQDAAAQGQVVQAEAQSLAELRLRHGKLRDALRELEHLPALGKALRYRTPVSQPVHAEQLMFELRQNRISFVDITALLAEVRNGLEEKARQLQSARQASGTVGPIGAFRMQYTLERERGVLDSVAGAAESGTQFRYGLSEWRVEPVSGTRGESVEHALAAGSAFRQIVDAVDPRQAVITIWVYPDSFAAYRQLRDYLHDREVVVAGRPLPEDAPIAASRNGSVSRGQ